MIGQLPLSRFILSSGYISFYSSLVIYSSFLQPVGIFRIRWLLLHDNRSNKEYWLQTAMFFFHLPYRFHMYCMKLWCYQVRHDYPVWYIFWYRPRDPMYHILTDKTKRDIEKESGREGKIVRRSKYERSDWARSPTCHVMPTFIYITIASISVMPTF